MTIYFSQLTEDDIQNVKNIREIDDDELKTMTQKRILSSECSSCSTDICKDDVVICRVIVMSRLQGFSQRNVRFVKLRTDEERIGKLDSIVVALGDKGNVALPENFSYQDPLTAIKTRTIYTRCSKLASTLEAKHMSPACSEAAPTEESSLIDQYQKKFSVCKSLANFIKHNGGIKYLKTFAHYKYGDAVEWLGNQGARGEDGDDANGGSSGYSSNGDEDTRAATRGFMFEIKHFMESFLKPRTPQSVKYATSQMQFYTLSPPTNLGMEKDGQIGMLFMTTDDEAHMLHKKADSEENEVTEEAVMKYFQYCIKSIDQKTPSS